MRMRNICNTPHEIHGHPVTAQRSLLLKLILDAGGHIDAKELYRRASSEDLSISLATVYRTLHLFKELGLVDERRLGQTRCYYEIKQPTEHQHLVCRGCGRVTDFESPLIGKLLDEVQRRHDFNITRAELCLEGYCPGCQPKVRGGN